MQLLAAGHAPDHDGQDQTPPGYAEGHFPLEHFLSPPASLLCLGPVQTVHMRPRAFAIKDTCDKAAQVDCESGYGFAMSPHVPAAKGIHPYMDTRNHLLAWVRALTHKHTHTHTHTHRTVLYNTIGNAVKFTEKGSVDVSVTLTGGSLLTVAVRDTGPGIPEDKIHTLFQAFAQVCARRTCAAAANVSAQLSRVFLRRRSPHHHNTQ